MITPQNPPKQLVEETHDPLDDLSSGSFDSEMRLQARIAALDSAARSLAGSRLGRNPAVVLVRAETFERWLLRGDRPTD